MVSPSTDLEMTLMESVTSRLLELPSLLAALRGHKTMRGEGGDYLVLRTASHGDMLGSKGETTRERGATNSCLICPRSEGANAARDVLVPVCMEITRRPV